MADFTLANYESEPLIGQSPLCVTISGNGVIDSTPLEELAASSLMSVIISDGCMLGVHNTGHALDSDELIELVKVATDIGITNCSSIDIFLQGELKRKMLSTDPVGFK